MTWYEKWHNALLAPGTPAPDGLTSWNGSCPSQRFGIYRNNVLISLRNALIDTFPALRDHLGHARFAALALDYICLNPPCSAVMAHYGGTLTDWMEKQDQWQLPPWCHELARLERAYVDSFHAEDSLALTWDDWQALLADTARLAYCRPRLHPSCHLLNLHHDILPLWSASHEAARRGQTLDWEGKLPPPALRQHTLCVLREEDGVAVIELTPEAAAALRGIAAGDTLAATLAAIDNEAQRIAILSHWIRLPLFSALEVTS